MYGSSRLIVTVALNKYTYTGTISFIRLSNSQVKKNSGRSWIVEDKLSYVKPKSSVIPFWASMSLRVHAIAKQIRKLTDALGGEKMHEHCFYSNDMTLQYVSNLARLRPWGPVVFLRASPPMRRTGISADEVKSVQWRLNGGDCVSNHQPQNCLLNRLFRRRSKKTAKLRVTGLCAGNSPGTGESPHKWPVTQKMLWRHHEVNSFCHVCLKNVSLP